MKIILLKTYPPSGVTSPGGLPQMPAKHQFGGAPFSIPPLHAGRCSAPANQCLPSHLRASLGHVRCPVCRPHRRIGEPPPSPLLKLSRQRTPVRPAPSYLSPLPIRSLGHQVGAGPLRQSRVTTL